MGGVRDRSVSTDGGEQKPSRPDVRPPAPSDGCVWESPRLESCRTGQLPVPSNHLEKCAAWAGCLKFGGVAALNCVCVPNGGRSSYLLPRYIIHRPAKSTGQFLVKIVAQHFVLTRGPTTWRRNQPGTPPLAFTDNFLDGASDAASEDEVGHFAKQFQFCHCPSSFASLFDDGGHCLQNLIALFEPHLRHPHLNRKPTRYRIPCWNGSTVTPLPPQRYFEIPWRFRRASPSNTWLPSCFSAGL